MSGEETDTVEIEIRGPGPVVDRVEMSRERIAQSCYENMKKGTDLNTDWAKDLLSPPTVRGATVEQQAAARVVLMEGQ